MTNDEIRTIFFAECEEALASAERALNTCRESPGDMSAVNDVFRSVHSIKGGAGAFGFNALQQYTHGFETLLSDVREGLVPMTPVLLDLLLRALDLLGDHVGAAIEGGAGPDDADMLVQLAMAQANPPAGLAPAAAPAPAPAAVAEPEPAPPAQPEPAAPVAEAAPEVAAFDDLDFDLDAMLNDIAAEVTPENPAWRVMVTPSSRAMAKGSEPLLLLRELRALGESVIRIDASRLPDLDAFDPSSAYVSWEISLDSSVERDAIDDVFGFVGDEIEVVIDNGTGEASAAAPVTEPETAPVKAEAATPVEEPTPAPAPTPTSAPEVAVAAPAPAPASEPVVEAAAPAPEPKPEPVAPPAAAEAPVADTASTPAAKPVLVASQDAPAAPAAPAAAAASQSVRIDLGKLDQLIDTVGEMMIAQAMLGQLLSTQALRNCPELAMLESLTRDVQERAMAIRAQPISTVFSRVPRLLRELQTSTGKSVRLEVFGETTEIDKTIIERLSEPLTHLIRNAVDHGIEDAETRVASGKDAQGVLRLSAEQRAGRIIIRIEDDGKGIDQARVLAKAIERGLVAPDATLSPDEINSLIFAPGFSTAQTVSNISGRGVGMDVVQQNVKDLGGRIMVKTEPGLGTSFILTLPLTLAIADGMTVTVGSHTLVLPLTHIVENLRPEPGHVERLGNGRLMLNARDRFIPIISVGEALDLGEQSSHPTEAVLIIVDTENHGQAALLVDGIVDQRQVVIKSLSAHYRSIDSVTGATILGDGRVALIVDVDTLVATEGSTTQFRNVA